MIETKDLVKKYSGNTVLNLPDFKICAGECFGLVGNNGAGKTTFFSLILDLIEATSGKVLSKGIEVRMSEHWKKFTGSYLDERFLIDFLTPEEYLEFVRKTYSISLEDYKMFLERFGEFFNGEILNKKKYIRDLSRGNQKKIGIAASMLSNPEVLILDEPFPHLDPTSVFRLKKMLNEYHQTRRTTILISSHDLNHVTEVCERIAILERGNIIHDLKTNDSTLQKLQSYFAV
ncbi:MAG: ABC transporter ATP-binding protein [bacterium]